MSRKHPLMTKGQRGGSEGVLQYWGMIEEDFGISKTVISEIISQDLDMSHIAKFGKSSVFVVEDAQRATTKLSPSESKQPRKSYLLRIHSKISDVSSTPMYSPDLTRCSACFSN
ncbi:hypothetical protein HZH68_015506 [Vespula germanica]|uniref:Uncharacterized protein n=1 Tax=Vespula germanica TaxID=30212 RepID=A0A834J8L8_VESGE|nr:hypothetical protein HZH68_015506 [Vespula germanica]